MLTMKLIRNLIILAILAAAGVAVYFYLHTTNKTIEVSSGKINAIETMAELCTIELYNEIPVKDTVNNKVLFGIQKQRGKVSFDLEKIQVDSTGDTIRVILPPEIVEVNEATEDNSWQVIDSKGLALFTSNKLTAEEENLIKSKIRRNSINALYKNGTIERARAEGVKNLQTLMEKVYRKPVSVTDPTPKGTRP